MRYEPKYYVFGSLHRDSIGLCNRASFFVCTNAHCIWSCADTRGSNSATFFFYERFQKIQLAEHHRPASETPFKFKWRFAGVPIQMEFRWGADLNGVSLACRLWPEFECWLDSFVILGDLANIPYIFVIFQAGGPPLDPRMMVLHHRRAKN